MLSLREHERAATPDRFSAPMLLDLSVSLDPCYLVLSL
jgi:hypothetical protein